MLGQVGSNSERKGDGDGVSLRWRKTALLHLLARFYEPMKGQILVNESFAV